MLPATYLDPFANFANANVVSPERGGHFLQLGNQEVAA